MPANDKIEEITGQVLDMLVKHEPGEIITKVFFQRLKTDKPQNLWSFGNQMLCLAGYLHEHPDTDIGDAIEKMDYRGFRQWLDVRRCVMKGEHSHAFICNPLTKKVTDKKTGDEKYIVRGFKTTPVFEISQTEGNPLPDTEHDPRQDVIRQFDFMGVAGALGIKVRAGVSTHGEYGSYSSVHGVISVCTPEEMTFYHELAHAVDDYLLKQKTGRGLKAGQHVDQEIVAQFCSNVLAYISGKEVERTTAYTKQYITEYLNSENIGQSILELMSRINAVVEYVMFCSETQEKEVVI